MRKVASVVTAAANKQPGLNASVRCGWDCGEVGRSTLY